MNKKVWITAILCIIIGTVGVFSNVFGSMRYVQNVLQEGRVEAKEVATKNVKFNTKNEVSSVHLKRSSCFANQTMMKLRLLLKIHHFEVQI
ncbi:MAG: hypothetical protein ACRCWQ_01140 [Bacilli bacterium]